MRRLKMLVVAAVIAAGALLSGASWESKAHASALCSVTSEQAPIVLSDRITFRPTLSCGGAVQYVKVNTTNCGAVGGSVNGTKVLISGQHASCSPPGDQLYVGSPPYSVTSLNQIICQTGQSQTLWIDGFNWSERHGTTWTGPYGQNFESSFHNFDYNVIANCGW